MVIQDYSELVKRAKNGDTLAFEELYKGCYAFVVFVCKPFCESKEDLEDVTQDAFLQAFSKINQLENNDMFLPWIKRIAIHKCYRKSDEAKKREGSVVYTEDLNATRSEIEELNKSFLPTDCYENGEVRKELISAVAALPETQRKMVHLYYYVGMNTIEISKLHNCTDSYVRKTLFNARNTIKEKMHGRETHGAMLAPLGALFVAEEAAFVASYAAANATAISTTATTVVGAAIKQAAVAAKIATCGYVAACVLTTGIIATGIYHAVQATEYQDTEIIDQIEVAAIYEPAETEEPYYEEEIEEDVYIEEVNVTEYVPNVINEQPEIEPVYEPEPYEEELIPYEPEPVVDRTTEILAALANANTSARVNEIIRQYGFSVKISLQSSFYEIFSFYQTNQGSGDILIGVYEFEDEWHMRFTFFEGGVINMQTPDLISWLEATM